jgi:hypothetical protein
MRLRAVDRGREGWGAPFLSIYDEGVVGLRLLPKWHNDIPPAMSLDGQVVLGPDGVKESRVSLLRAISEAKRMNDEWERRKR